MHQTNRASSAWGSLSGSSTRPEQNKSYPTVPAQLINLSRGLAFCFSSAKTLWSKRRTEAKTPSGSTLDQALGIEGGELGAAASQTLGVCRSLCISPQRQLRLGVGGLCISLRFTHAWRAWAWIHLSSSPCSLAMPVYLCLILPAWLNLWETPVLAKAPPAETKAKRQSSLYRWHTNAEKENILSLEYTHTPTKSNKQKPKYTLRWLQTQRKGINGCLKDLYSLQSLDRQRFPQKLPDSRLSCKWGACLDSVFGGVNKLTLAASWDVRVATFSCEASSSRRSFLICCLGWGGWGEEEHRGKCVATTR